MDLLTWLLLSNVGRSAQQELLFPVSHTTGNWRGYGDGTGGTKAESVGSFVITGSLNQGSTIAITSDTLSFGTRDAQVAYRTPQKGVAHGEPLPLTNMGVTGVSARSEGAPLMDTGRAGFPHGTAMRIGGSDNLPSTTNYRGISFTDAVPTLEFMQTWYFQFPAANQDALAAIGLLPNSYNQKVLWTAYDGAAFTNSTDSDIFIGSPISQDAGGEWNDVSAINSNVPNITGAHSTPSGMIDPTDPTRYRSNVLLMQMWVKADPIAGGNNTQGFVRITDTVTGEIVAFEDLTGSALGGFGNTEYGTSGIAGFNRGFNEPLGANTLAGYVTKDSGAGAVARIEVHDSEFTHKVVASFAVNQWEDGKGINCTVDYGPFYQSENLVGKWIAMFDNDNVLIGGSKIQVT